MGFMFNHLPPLIIPPFKPLSIGILRIFLAPLTPGSGNKGPSTSNTTSNIFTHILNNVLTLTAIASNPRSHQSLTFFHGLLSIPSCALFFTCELLQGSSINTFDLKGKLYPLIYGGDAPAGEGIDRTESRYCFEGTLNKNLTRGKIVLCDGSSSGAGPLYAKAIGALTVGQNYRDVGFSLPLPGSYLNLQDGALVFDYINSTRTPSGTIFKSDELRDTLAPLVASFSSRGPNPVTPEILKPDLVAPGVTILAGWSPATPPTGVDGDKRKLLFNIISGTSMASPHVAGAAAYVKSFHPTWSPSAIRSALMTTAKQLNPKINRDAEFGYGAGQIDPSKAVNPGLVYDASEIDYVRFLCGQGYSSRTLQLLTGDNSNCSETEYGTITRDLNYPSFALQAPSNSANVSGSFNRTVTNVGSPKSIYKATVIAPQGLKIEVNPSVLSFSSLGQKENFVLIVEGTLEEFAASGSLVWDDGEFQVRSPIVVFNNAP